MATATKQRIAKITGTFAVPGVSKNNRLYTREHIAAAVTEAQALIDSGQGLRVAMLTNHGARDPLLGDVTRTAGQVTKVSQAPDGRGLFEADIADTSAGRDVAALTTPDKPYLTGVSMASMWTKNRRKIMHSGQPVETADGFSLKGIDFTHNPGVNGAQIDSAELTESAPDGLICEDLEEVILVEQTGEVTEPTEATEAEGASTFADPGYHGEKRFKLDTPSDVRTSWVEMHRGTVTESYSPKQVRRMRGKVKGAAQKLGIDVVEETNLLGAEILEAYTSVCVDNGPADMRVAAYVDDPEKLPAVVQKVAMAAMAALYQLDPDNDGDIDLPGGDNDTAECPSCNAEVPMGALFCPTCGQAIPQGESAPNQKEGVVPESKENKGAANESTLTMTPAELEALVTKGANAALEAAGVKPNSETAPVTESDELIAARKLIAEADATVTSTETTPAPAATEAAVPAGSVVLSEDRLKALLEESATKTLDIARKEIQEAGPRRRGLVSQSVLEQAPEDLYGDHDLTKATDKDLANLADNVVAPLLNA